MKPGYGEGQCPTCRHFLRVGTDLRLPRHSAGGAVAMNREYREDDK